MKTHPFPTPERPRSIIETLVAWRERTPDRCALTILREGETVEQRATFRELHDEVMQFATGLRQRCVPGARVLLLLPTGVEFVVAFFGCLAAGMVAIPASPPMQPRKVSLWKKVQAIVENSGATLVVAPDSALEPLAAMKAAQGLFAGCALESLASLRAAIDRGTPIVMPSPADLAFLQYTSGSTGAPKGVMLTHGNIVNNQEVIAGLMGHDAATRVVSWLPLYHDMGLSAILQMASVGLELVLMSPVAFIQKPLRWLQAISTHRAHTTGGPNFAYRLATAALQSPDAAAAGIDLSSWRLAFCGAEPIHRETVDHFLHAAAAHRFDAGAFHACYGLAEATVQVTGAARGGIRYLDVSGAGLAQGRVELVDSEQAGRKTLVACGAPCAGNEVRIVGADGAPVAAENGVGEIWVRGPSVGIGYYGNARASQDTFGAHLHGDDGGTFMRTGDLGAFVGGQLYVTGRVKDLLIIRGRNLYPQDVEDCIQDALPELRRGHGAAFTVSVDNEEKLVIVQEVSRTQRRSIDVADVFRRIVVAVGDEFGLTPHQVVLVEPATIEKTSSGKIARALCRRAYLGNELQSVATWTEGQAAAAPAPAAAPVARAGDGATQAVALRRDIEQHIASVAAGFLKIDVARVPRTTPWSELGFDSMNALQLALKVEQATGIKLDATLLWECANIEELAARLAGMPGAAALLGRQPAMAPAQPQPQPAAQVARIAPRNFEELAALSDAEAEALLLKELER